MSIKTYKQATWEAMKEEMLRDSTVYAIAEDMRGTGGLLGQYTGLGDAIGDESRLLDAPISETAIVASGVGAALAGMRPVVDLRFSNCMFVCMDEIINQAAKSRYMFGGQGKVHMVIRSTDGILAMQGAHHTDCLDAWFAHVPGLQVVLPSGPAEAKGLLKTAIRNDNPVVFLEHKALYAMEEEVPDEEYTLPFQARIARAGTDVTIVVYSIMVSRAMEAAKALAEAGISAEVIDLRSISPWDKEAVLASVAKTGHAVVATEGPKQGGFGGEISATIAEEAFSSLKAPVQRLGGPFVPIPVAPNLEDLCRVTPADIAAAAKAALGRA